MSKIILHNRPCLDRQEIKTVSNVLKSGWLAQGPQVEKLERAMVSYLGSKNAQALAFSSGTAALYVALVALGIKKGDQVIIPTYVCSALLNAIYLTGAQPVLVDIDEEDLNISVPEARKKITSKTKAIIVTHTFGYPGRLTELLKLGVPIIEDCAQALGAKYRGRQVGNFGRLAIFSFYATKMITSGYGGLVYSRDKELMAKVRDFRQFDGQSKYRPRFNFSMSDLQASIALVQLRKLPTFLAKRQALAAKYYKVWRTFETWPGRQSNAVKPNYYRFLLRTAQAKEVKTKLARRQIEAAVPIRQSELLHRTLGQAKKGFPVAEKVSVESLSLPIFPALRTSEIKRLLSVFKTIV